MSDLKRRFSTFDLVWFSWGCFNLRGSFYVKWASSFQLSGLYLYLSKEYVTLALGRHWPRGFLFNSEGLHQYTMIR